MPRPHESPDGVTPLSFAAQEDASEAVKLLLGAGADLTAQCAGSRNHLVAAGPHAGENHHPGRFSGYSPLHYCAHYNAHHAARVLLAHPAARAAMEISDLSERLARQIRMPLPHPGEQQCGAKRNRPMTHGAKDSSDWKKWKPHQLAAFLITMAPMRPAPIALFIALFASLVGSAARAENRRPNILSCISDVCGAAHFRDP